VVGKFALPATFLLSASRLDLAAFELRVIITVILAKYVMVGVACVAARLTDPTARNRVGTMGIFALFFTQSNDVAIGLPVVTALYPIDEYPTNYPGYLIVLSCLQVVLVNPVCILLMEIGKSQVGVHPPPRISLSEPDPLLSLGACVSCGGQTPEDDELGSGTVMSRTGLHSSEEEGIAQHSPSLPPAAAAAARGEDSPSLSGVPSLELPEETASGESKKSDSPSSQASEPEPPVGVIPKPNSVLRKVVVGVATNPLVMGSILGIVLNLTFGKEVGGSTCRPVGLPCFFPRCCRERERDPWSEYCLLFSGGALASHALSLPRSSLGTSWATP